jgi:Mor family transcriptional regulator
MGRNRNFSKEEKELICQKYISGQSADSLGRDYEVSGGSIRRILKQNNIAITSGNKKRDHLIPAAVEDYRRGVLFPDILKKYNFSPSYLRKVIKKHCGECNILSRAILLTDNHVNMYNNIDTAINILNASTGRDKLSDVGRYFGIRKSAVKSIFKIHNIDICGIKSNNKATKDKLNDPEICEAILDKYITQKISAQQIGKEYNITPPTIRQFILNQGQYWRDKKEATLLSNHSIEHNIASIKGSYRSKPYTLPSGKVIKLQGYEPDFLDFVFSLEILSESDFEFDNGFRIQYSDNPIKHYYPDFYIPKFDLMIEIKSAYTLRKADPRKAEECGKIHNYICIVDKQYGEFVKMINSFNAPQP